MSLRVQNLQRQEVTPSQIDNIEGIIPYGTGNNFPLRLARLVNKSPTASSCIDTKSDFVEGAGFSDSTLADLKINNQGTRFGDFHAFNADAISFFDGIAINVKYNVQGTVSEIYNIPFESCRFATPDSKCVINKILVNPYFGTGEYDKKHTKEYDVYNPDKKAVLSQQAKAGRSYLGQIFYVATTGPLSRQYPVPKYYSAEYWMSIDEAIGGFHKHNIDNAFLQSVILQVIGDPNAPSEHPDDVKWNSDNTAYEPDPQKTNGYRFNIEMQKFAGWSKAGNVMTLWGKNKEEVPTIEPFPTNQNSELFKTIQDLTTEIISRATKVPSILANIQSGASLGGDGNMIRSSVKLMQQRVVKIQALLERTYKEIFSHWENKFKGDVKILHHNPFPELEKIDPLIWAALPIESQRAWIKKNTDFEIPDTPQPGAQPINRFSNVFYADYPEGAKKNAKRAIDFRDKMGSKCGGKAGWTICDEIIKGSPISFKKIKRIHNYLSKNKTFEAHLFTDSCESLLFSAWGGAEMLKWSEEKIKSINE